MEEEQEVNPPVWDRDYPVVMAGEFDTSEFLENRGPVPSGRREREYGLPSILSDAEMGVVFDYLDDPLVYKRTCEVRRGWRWNNDGDVKTNYGQGGVTWDR